MTANVPLQVLIDSGASINVIDEKAYHAITKSPQNNQLSLRHTSTKIYSYGGTSPLPVIGTFSTRVESKTRTPSATIYVIKDEKDCLLSYKTASLQLNYNLSLSSLKPTHLSTPPHRFPHLAAHNYVLNIQTFLTVLAR